MSIITVVFNGVGSLEKTIKSVINQTYERIEYIIIDGGSTDGTLSIIETYSSHISKWISEQDKGICDAFNKGIHIASGDIIGLINADDWYEPDAVALAVDVLKGNRRTIAHGITQYWRANTRMDLVEGNHRRLDRNMTINHPTVFATRDCYEDFGVFDLGFRCAMDYEWLLRAKNRGAAFRYIPKLMANMELGGISDKQWRLAVREVARAKARHIGGIQPTIYFAYQITKGSIKRMLEAMGLDFIVRWYHAHVSVVSKIRMGDTE